MKAPSARRPRFHLRHLLALVSVVALLSVLFAPVLRKAYVGELDWGNGARKTIEVDYAVLASSLLENTLFALITFFFVRLVATRAEGKPVQFRIKTIFLLTTAMAITFALLRSQSSDPRLLLMGLGLLALGQAVVYTIATLVLRRLETSGEGTFWRSVFGMVVAGMANAGMLMLVQQLPHPLSYGFQEFIHNVFSSYLPASLLALCIGLAIFGGVLAVLWQDAGGKAPRAGFGAGAFLGTLLTFAIAPFVIARMREHIFDLLTVPMFLGLGGYLANLRGPRPTETVSLPAAVPVYPDFDEAPA